MSWWHVHLRLILREVDWFLWFLLLLFWLVGFLSVLVCLSPLSVMAVCWLAVLDMMDSFLAPFLHLFFPVPYSSQCSHDQDHPLSSSLGSSPVCLLWCCLSGLHAWKCRPVELVTSCLACGVYCCLLCTRQVSLVHQHCLHFAIFFKFI